MNERTWQKGITNSQTFPQIAVGEIVRSEMAMTSSRSVTEFLVGEFNPLTIMTIALQKSLSTSAESSEVAEVNDPVEYSVTAEIGITICRNTLCSPSRTQLIIHID